MQAQQEKSGLYLTDFNIRIGDIATTSLHPELLELFSNSLPTYEDLLLSEHLFDQEQIEEWQQTITTPEAQQQVCDILAYMKKRKLSYIRSCYL